MNSKTRRLLKELFKSHNSAAVLAGCLVFLAVGGLAFFQRNHPGYWWWLNTLYLFGNAGEALHHGVPGRVLDLYFGGLAWPALDPMPLTSLLPALMFYHSSLTPDQWHGVACFIILLLEMALAGLTAASGPALAFLALAAALLPGMTAVPWANWERGFFTVFTLLTAWAAAWRAARPTPGRTLLLALSIGISLCFRSTLAFFPLWLAASEFFPAKGTDRKRFGVSTLILCVVPFLPLLPWIRLHWIIQHKLVLFEPHQADSNIITGALGMPHTICGNAFALIPGGLPPNQSLLGWAMRYVLAHPAAYLKAFLGRAWYALSLQPLLWSAAALGFWKNRRIAEFRALALLVLYFIVLYCLMSVEEGYFRPLWPILLIAAASLFTFHPLKSRIAHREAPRWFLTVSRGVAGTFMTLGTLCAVYSMAKVAAYAGVPRTDARTSPALEKAAAAFPRDPWVWSEMGYSALRGGNAPAAARYWERSVKERYDPAVDLARAFARALSGKPGELLRWRCREKTAGMTELTLLLANAGFLQAFVLDRLGRREKARVMLLQAASPFCRDAGISDVGGWDASDRRALTVLRRNCRRNFIAQLSFASSLIEPIDRRWLDKMQSEFGDTP